ncbi:MAG: transglycosylase family protein [Solirubrobacterales bacterium]
MLTKRTYSKHSKHRYLLPVLLVALALPAVALAAPGPDGGAAQQIDLGQAQPAGVASLTGPVQRFHRAIDIHVQRIRAARRARAAKLRREREEAFATLPGGVSMATLESIASCESGGDPTIVSSDGSYRGKYQFSVETWASVGGSGDPAAAPEDEQDYRAALLYAQSGSSPWPVCG